MNDTVATVTKHNPSGAKSPLEFAKMIGDQAVGFHQGQRSMRRAKRPDIGPQPTTPFKTSKPLANRGRPRMARQTVETTHFVVLLAKVPA
ncbi:MAG TPA: hypothetical protein VMI72_15570 [Roseiarcus sp.]|nr:hypothetical protein [Roseiarcus sp.]